MVPLFQVPDFDPVVPPGQRENVTTSGDATHGSIGGGGGGSTHACCVTVTSGDTGQARPPFAGCVVTVNTRVLVTVCVPGATQADVTTVGELHDPAQSTAGGGGG